MVEEMNREEIFSKAVRAGKRTYFFDVKATKGSDLYLTITESKKRYRDDSSYYYEKHKLFLYKEDFDKFYDALNDALNEISKLKETGNYNVETTPTEKNEYVTDVEFDDLGVS